MPRQELRFDDRVAIVTGAGRGIGRAHALALAERGAKVVVNDLGNSLSGIGADDGPAHAVAAEIVAAGGEAVPNAGDVATETGARSIVATALERFGRIDVLVNNAGNLEPDEMPALERSGLERHLDIHVVGHFNVTRAAWPTMVEQGYGRVVMTASVGLLGGPSLIAYSTAKGGVLSLGRSLAPVAAEHGIKVNLLAPAAETRMVTDTAMRARANLPPLGAGSPPGRGPELVVPMLLVLAHESCPVNGELFEAGLGRFSRLFVAETRGVVGPDLTAEDLLDRWDEIVDEAGYRVHTTTKDALDFREAILARARTPG